MKPLKLVKPNLSYAEEIMSFRQEFLAAGSSMDGCGGLRHCETAEQYIERCEKYADPATVPPGHIPDTQFMLVCPAERRILGMIQIRDMLNDYLRAYGGNIGYCVRPSERRKGYAGEMLRLGLERCREAGLPRVMITCIDGNTASEKTILSAGGVYENSVLEPKENLLIKRFWIDL